MKCVKKNIRYTQIYSFHIVDKTDGNRNKKILTICFARGTPKTMFHWQSFKHGTKNTTVVD